ncbi:MAG TPA: methyltransferase domain-containing protein [Sphingomicrobium sp.]|jgi:SAM-dependent methyltransferase
MSEAKLAAPDWARANGDIWGRRWRDTDRGLGGLSKPLVDAIVACAPDRDFDAFEVGCGPGTTTLDVADACPRASVVACDISPSLAAIARDRSGGRSNIRVVIGDAAERASDEAPFDLVFSRHGVMFFADPVGAFSALRAASNSGAALVFSCFRDWSLNPWAVEVADAVAGTKVPAPGREPSGFAFADPAYARELLEAAGWEPHEPQPIDFTYVAADGGNAVADALDFFSEIGPAARLMAAMDEKDRRGATERMRSVLERHCAAGAVSFPAAAWIWTATAP